MQKRYKSVFNFESHFASKGYLPIIVNTFLFLNVCCSDENWQKYQSWTIKLQNRSPCVVILLLKPYPILINIYRINFVSFIHFNYSFPKSGSALLKEWLVKMRRDKWRIPNKYSTMCSILKKIVSTALAKQPDSVKVLFRPFSTFLHISKRWAGTHNLYSCFWDVVSTMIINCWRWNMSLLIHYVWYFMTT